MISRRQIAIVLALMLMLTACGTMAPDEDTSQAGDIGLANPAAVYCEGLGYEMETVETPAGQDAVCIFPDGSQCGQWDFLAGRCGQEFSYCEQQGYDLIETDGNVGTCMFTDGSYCVEIEFFEGTCGPES